jgi:transposase InsO family protein
LDIPLGHHWRPDPGAHTHVQHPESRRAGPLLGPAQGRGIAAGLAIRHDHGSAYLSDDFQAELAFRGMARSPSFVREPEGNGVAERFIRTLKENLLWVRHFATVVELIEALQAFKRRYNAQWLIERHRFRTPSQARLDCATRSKRLDDGPSFGRVG